VILAEKVICKECEHVVHVTDQAYCVNADCDKNQVNRNEIEVVR